MTEDDNMKGEEPHPYDTDRYAHWRDMRGPILNRERWLWRQGWRPRTHGSGARLWVKTIGDLLIAAHHEAAHQLEHAAVHDNVPLTDLVKSPSDPSPHNVDVQQVSGESALGTTPNDPTKPPPSKG